MRKLLRSLPVLSLTVFSFLSGCSDDSSTGGSSTGGPAMTDDQYSQAAVAEMHELLLQDIQAMRAAAIDLQGAAPAPPDRGWDPALDAEAIAAMRASWVEARAAYELGEGALAPLFPNIDNAIDARYDDFMTQLGAEGGDSDLFDGAGVTGMHAIERILYADVTPQYVIDFEATLPGYVPAAFPATAAEAASFKDELCSRFISDTETLEEQWTPANINVVIAFQGLIALIQEQSEKVQKAASFEEESRYSQRTMADLRANLAGSKDVYAAFQPWIVSKSDPSDPSKDGGTIDEKIQAGFAKLDAAYQAVAGDAIPTPPPTWSSVNPSEADRMTPFGQLFTAVEGAVDRESDDAIVTQLNNAARVLGFPDLQGG
jgi:iron uptake system component EfeO